MSYFSEQLNAANENFLGADGWGADGWKSTDAQEYVQADAVAVNAQSKPFIFSIVNTTTAAVSSVEIMDANLRQGLSGYTGLTYTNGYANMTYQQVLASIASGMGFEAGLVKLIYSHATEATAIANVTEVLTLTTNSMSGSVATETFVPILDDYQQIKTQVTVRHAFLVTGLVSLKINQLLGSTTVKVMIWPKSVINQFGLIKGSNGYRGFTNPNITPALGQ